MRTDLDRLMADNDLDAIVVLSSGADPAVAYLTGSRKLTSALITKRRGQAASVAVSSIERDNVPESGLTLHLLDESVYAEAYRSSRSRMLAALELYTHTLDKMGIVRGRVGFHGRTSVGLGYRLLTHLTEALPAIEIITDIDPPVVGQARATKDESELSQMVDVGTRTSAVMVAARDYVRSHRVSGSGFIKPSGAPLTVSDVKRYTLGQLVESDLEDPEGMIFAPGAEGAVPHNPGQPDTQIRLGVPVVFDLFPRGIDGYFHDVTRTWCFGHAPDDVRTLHADVLGCFRQVVTAARAGATGEHLQRMACDYFRDRGHPVAADDRSRLEGFTTGLGHGVGLAVHEFPYLGEQQSTPLVPGHVFTVEPGLYYPGREMGVRIEDTLHCTSDGIVETITDVPYDLLVPLA